MLIVPLPKNPELERLMSGLLGRDVKVAPAEGLPAEPITAAYYKTDEPVLEVVALADLSLAASVAAALSVMPPDTVKDVVGAGQLGGALEENLAEVWNVTARFVSMSGRRFALVSCHTPSNPLPPELLEKARQTDEGRAVQVEVSGYGAGRLAFQTV